MHSTMLRLSLAAALALALTACAPMSVNSFVERHADLATYRTFMWGPPDAAGTGDPRLDNNRFFDERVRAQVEVALERHGLEKLSSGMPDLLVHYHANFEQDIDARQLDPRYSYCAAGDCRPFVYDKGTLFVDLVDPRGNRLIWRGWAEGAVNGVVDNQAWMESRVDEAIARILRRLPNRL
ncbi:MAG TPA: DUF4136 domain-containing protein [Vicinamibacterales bacterium]|nr:DUF4136 domain-containing protein [Vicinamibacterales bacterium]